MDAFFAAIEQRDHPELKGKPVVVGGDPFGRGVVSTASYEARQFGIRSAMPAAHARRLCPGAVFLRPDFKKYSEASGQIMGILRQHTHWVEPVSLDEAYMDVTENRFKIGDPVILAKLLKQTIFARTRLTASAGVAPNLFLAKIASDYEKPDGLTVILPEQVASFLEDLPVRKIPGVGPVTEKELHALGITKCGELAVAKEEILARRLGKNGIYLRDLARGIDERKVEPDVLSKQLSTEETFQTDIRDKTWLETKLRGFAEEVFRGLQADGRMGRTVVLKVKYFDFEQITRSKTLDHYPEDAEEIFQVAARLMTEKTEAGRRPVRLLGLGISNLDERPVQKDLFEL